MSHRSYINYSEQNLKNVPGVKRVRKHVRRLDISWNKITRLENFLTFFPRVTKLNLSENRLRKIPRAIGELRKLRELNVSKNDLVKLPKEIGDAKSLTNFNCSDNDLTELPSSLGRCDQLKILNASINKITKLPRQLSNCLKLEELNVKENRLKKLRKSLFASLKLLKMFDAGDNKLVSIPNSIEGLVKLMYLNLEYNKLVEFPVEACEMQLEVLNLRGNRLTILPAELGKMITLKKLKFNNNPLKTPLIEFADKPTKEFLSYLRSKLPQKEATLIAFKDVDYGDLKKTAPVQDQGPYGLCWAYATINLLLSHVFQKHSKFVELSVQDLANEFDRKASGIGVPLFMILGYAKVHGIPIYSDYVPTWFYNGPTPDTVKRLYPIKDFIALDPDDSARIRLELETHGPVLASILARPGLEKQALSQGLDPMATYDNNIIVNGEVRFGHVVLIVAATEDAFVIQNSWGPEFGIGGFLKMKTKFLEAVTIRIRNVPPSFSADTMGESSGAPISDDVLAGLYVRPPLPSRDITEDLEEEPLWKKRKMN